MEMSDDLHKINDLYSDHLKDVEHILIVTDQALASIPNVRTFTAGAKFTVKGGGMEEEAEVEVLNENGEVEEAEEEVVEEEEDDDDENQNEVDKEAKE